jgi:hypothetical protein
LYFWRSIERIVSLAKPTAPDYPKLKTFGLEYTSCPRHLWVQKISSGGTIDVVPMGFIPLQEKKTEKKTEKNVPDPGYRSCLRHWMY